MNEDNIKNKISKISCSLPSPLGDGLFEIFEPEKKTLQSNVHCLKAVVYFFSVLQTFSLLKILADKINNITDNICNSIPFNGRTFKLNPLPKKIPEKAGNNPTMQPGQAPPINPKNTAIEVNPPLL